MIAKLARAFYHLTLSESRVTIFVSALLTSYLIASDLHPNLFTVTVLGVSGYLLTLSIYVLNALMDIKADMINSPSRPIASGLVSVTDAKAVFLISAGSSIVLSLLISFPTAALFLISLFLGVSYSMPRVHAKKRLTGKLVVTSCGAALCSLTGGVAAEDLNATVFFVAVAFALFALVTLLLGDIADMTGDVALHVSSLPAAIGPRRTIAFIISLPLVLSALGVFLLRFTNFNPIFPILLIGVSGYSSLSITRLLRDYQDPRSCRKVKSRMRLMHFVLQLTFLFGLLSL
ncbi:MAG: UbiA prenyltransferase family protein [Nitrososphaerales archaeon]